MTWQRVCVAVGVVSILVGWLWNGPLVWGHFLGMLALLWVAFALVDGARIWKLNRRTVEKRLSRRPHKPEVLGSTPSRAISIEDGLR